MASGFNVDMVQGALVSFECCESPSTISGNCVYAYWKIFIWASSED